MEEELKYDLADELPELGKNWLAQIDNAAKISRRPSQRDDASLSSDQNDTASSKQYGHGSEDEQADFSELSDPQATPSDDKSADEADEQSAWVQMSEDASSSNSPASLKFECADGQEQKEDAVDDKCELEAEEEEKCSNERHEKEKSATREEDTRVKKKFDEFKRQYLMNDAEMRDALKNKMKQIEKQNHDLHRQIQHIQTTGRRHMQALPKIDSMTPALHNSPSDERHVCWEFNTPRGCPKGNACWWSHQWLQNDMRQPYTGELLIGIQQRLKQDPGCMDQTAHRFHDNGTPEVWVRRNNEYRSENPATTRYLRQRQN